MLRGSYAARVDDKGRLKVPSEFRNLIDKEYGSKLFVTSLDGRSARVYPLAVWESIEAKLAALPSTDPARRKFLRVVNYYGQHAELDAQGRVLVHPRLRDAAGLTADVDVIGSVNFMELWNAERCASDVHDHPITDEELARLSAAGV